MQKLKVIFTNEIDIGVFRNVFANKKVQNEHLKKYSI